MRRRSMLVLAGMLAVSISCLGWMHHRESSRLREQLEARDRQEKAAQELRDKEARAEAEADKTHLQRIGDMAL